MIGSEYLWVSDPNRPTGGDGHLIRIGLYLNRLFICTLLGREVRQIGKQNGYIIYARDKQPFTVRFFNMGKRNKQSDTSPWKKKGRRGWTTDAQEEFPSSHIPSYLEGKTGSVHIHSDFWAPIWEQFFDKWPLELKSEKEKEEDKVDPDRLKKGRRSVYYQCIMCT
jgi:hypothetical protein